MKFMQALSLLQDGYCIGIYRDVDPSSVIHWKKSQFKDFYSGKVIEIDQAGLFADDWELFEYNKS